MKNSYVMQSASRATHNSRFETSKSDNEERSVPTRIIPDSSSYLDGMHDNGSKTLHSHAEIWKWTLTKDAIARCRVEDILHLQECDGAKAGTDPDFFWLGNVPCRSVLFYGIIVGVQVYEQRVVYTVDDGSGKIDCNMRSSPHPISEQQAIPHPKNRHNSSNPPPDSSSSTKSQMSLGMTISTAPRPIAVVGDLVLVVGRVLKRHQSRLVNLDNLMPCKDATEEPLHWLSVIGLHETWYNAAHTRPFVVPAPSITALAECSGIQTADNDEDAFPNVNVRPSLPSPASPSKSSVASSAPTTPSSVASSSTASQHSSLSPPRLRHPSRLHTRDLTANTFRIYVKHYMDNAPTDAHRSTHRSSSMSDTSGDEAEVATWLDQVPGTPTKSLGAARFTDMTPRPSKFVRVDDTPKVRPKTNETARGDEAGTLLGYPLSHLRRVPELALLARRVVEAEGKRRAKEERTKRKEEEAKAQSHTRTRSTSKSFSAASTSQSRRSGASDTVKKTSSILGKSNEGEPIYAKMKRLFRYAIRQLYDEGSIVLWDGPIRPLPRPYTPIPQPNFSTTSDAQASIRTNDLWKISSTVGGSTTVSSISSISQTSLDDDLGDLSDPSPDEESYIPLTPAYLSKIVEVAIVDLMSRLPLGSHRSKVAPRPGPTVNEIVEHLHRRDARWARVGEWAVKEALEWGRAQGAVWCIGDGRWEVCG